MEKPAQSLQAKSLTKPTVACVRCSARKVRCNRQNPCSACARRDAPCTYRPQKQVQLDARSDELTDRLRYCEALLEAKSVDIDREYGYSEPKRRSDAVALIARETSQRALTTDFRTPERKATVFKPQLMHSQSSTGLVNNNLWARLAEEIHDNGDALLEGLSGEADSDRLSVHNFTYVLDWPQSGTPFSHPSREIILRLWKIFVENVNPLTKIIHVPTLQPAIEKAINGIEHIPLGFEALMFSIYSMALLSLTEDKCQEIMSQSRRTVLSYYVAGTKVALMRAKFMSSTSIVVMQALLFHILSIRDDCEPRALWNLTGLAIRVAEGMGMRLDGTVLRLSPFESEIRRRIWWQLKLHDSRAAELCGQAKFRDFDLNETSAKKPANINDGDLCPMMEKAPQESFTPTEMVWIALRSELATFALTQRGKLQQTGSAGSISEDFAAFDDLKEKDKYIAQIEDMVETRFLQYCDPSEPLHFLVQLGARYALDFIRFTAHHPRRWVQMDQVPEAERELIWGLVLQLLERCNMMQSSLQLRRFAWNMPYFIQWHAVIHVLDTLRLDPLHFEATRAWQLIETMYELNHNMLLCSNKPIYVAVGRLCLKAFRARTIAVTEWGHQHPELPAFIFKLQEQRRQAEVKREARTRREEQFTVGAEHWMPPDTNWSKQRTNFVNSATEMHPQQTEHAFQRSTYTRDDVYWLSANSDDYFVADGTFQSMDLDMDLGGGLNISGSDPVDWAQWDALLIT